MRRVREDQAEGATAADTSFPALQTNIGLVAQAIELLKTMTQSDYVAINSPATTTIGSHLRHVIEFYQAFLDQWQGQQVRYYRRERSQAIETEKDLARAALSKIQQQLKLVAQNSPLQVHHFDGDRSQSDTTRELSYLADHATHHFALIKIIAHIGGVRPAESFGFAPSTLANQRLVERHYEKE